jgi:shikimate kinase
LTDPAALAPTRRKLRRTVVLIGLMGAGKTSVGKRLAEALGARFRDSDDEIVEAAGMDIPAIFKTLGEPAFRQGERRVISRMLAEPPHVLATGGGAFMDPETRAAVKRKAVSVWLRADLDTLVERTARKTDRPLLRTGDPRATLSALMNQRYPIYAEADLTVDTEGDAPHEQVVASIIDALESTGALA